MANGEKWPFKTLCVFDVVVVDVHCVGFRSGRCANYNRRPTHGYYTAAGHVSSGQHEAGIIPSHSRGAADDFRRRRGQGYAKHATASEHRCSHVSAGLFSAIGDALLSCFFTDPGNSLNLKLKISVREKSR